MRNVGNQPGWTKNSAKQRTHKRPGRTAKQERRARALDQLQRTPVIDEGNRARIEKEMATLRARIGLA